MVAVRISAHPLVREICNHIDKPIVSTSANPAGQPAALSEQQVLAYFGDQLHIVEGELGGRRSPSKIFNSLTMEAIRE
jgi:tRNA A37 threonylcarbamoyladenosine synthetase subunit TsaC/SUA5/YrdC